MNARQVPVNDIRPALALQKHEPLKDDHQRAHIQPLTNEVGSQLEWWVSHDGIGLRQPELHEKVYGVRTIWASIIDKILSDHLMTSLTQNLDDGPRSTARFQNARRKRLAAQERVRSLRGRFVAVVLALP
jgi:hypothetical protein